MTAHYPTDLKLDIVWWDDEKNLLRIVELTIPFETTLDDAAERKKPSMKSWSRVHNKLATLLLLPPSKWEHMVYRTSLAFRP